MEQKNKTELEVKTIESLNDEYNTWKRDYGKESSFDLKDIHFKDRNLLPIKLKIFQVLYDRLRDCHYRILINSKHFNIVNQNNARTLSERMGLDAETIQFKYITPITLKLNDFENRKSKIREFIYLLLSLILGLVSAEIYSSWKNTNSTNEIKKIIENNNKEVIYQIDSLRNEIDTLSDKIFTNDSLISKE